MAFALLAAGNAYAVVISHVLKRRTVSWVPLVGGAAGCLAILAAPVSSWHAWWWVPLLLDWGSIPGFVHAAIVLALGRTDRRG